MKPVYSDYICIFLLESSLANRLNCKIPRIIIDFPRNEDDQLDSNFYVLVIRT